VNLCHFFDFCHPKNPNEKYTPPYGTARGDPILMEGTVVFLNIELFLTHPKLGKRRRRILKTKLMLDFSFHQDEVHRKTYSWLPSFSFCG
jgi:hypothetical protein